MSIDRYVIVGASLAGLSAAETLRSNGYEGQLVMVGQEHRLPYDRPPLSKQILNGSWMPERAFLRKDADYDKLGAVWKLGQRAASLDLHARAVILEGGESIAFDGPVIATGATARRLPGVAGLEGIHVLRTLDDAIAIRAQLDNRPRVCVVGAGFIGAEVAAACRARGLEVTLVEALAAPLAQVLPPELASACVQLHRDHGVELRCGATVEGFEGHRRVEAVRLPGGERVPADLVIVGIGVIPETGWLASSGLAIDNGLVCDATLATAVPGIVAAGDVARWPNLLFGETMRIEHWTNALDQGAAAARRLLQGEAYTQPFAPVPYVWSDQYETKIQMVGRIKPGDEVRLVHGSYEQGRFVAVTGRAGRLVGALAFNEPRQLMGWRQPIAAGTAWPDALAKAAAKNAEKLQPINQ
ncbi:MAG: FAD-dependent oxidoreductase [Pseudomonadota bacterium]|nr:FAD-dependent oxidoreductase [Pseudomonadota bacterium]